MSAWLLMNQSVIESQPVNDLQAVQSDKMADIMQQVCHRLLFFAFHLFSI